MRVEGWEANLDRLLGEYKEAGFDRGTRDCLWFALDVVHVVTGRELYPEERGSYTNLAEGAERLRARGFRNTHDVIAANCDEIPVADARTGDLGVAPAKGGPTLVVFRGGEVLGLTQRGLTTMPREHATRAFRVE